CARKVWGSGLDSW
nr:immunoglobulin heavy chain junction region [Macaca mulatta]